MGLQDFIRTNTVTAPLTREEFDKAMEAIGDAPPDSPYNHPHSPRCKAVETQTLSDCNCGTRGWLISIGFGGWLTPLPKD